ncbi:DUF1800 domain-containing protein [Pseudoduganella violacea]|uniref:Uncharacterized protein (DUF1800 family) n=1 Tax=Pseudoduganella violacea TaxID=1715466 RepID=A0A7W5BBJ3_9BURK|nr:DUF1800 domain-containing protein [Pseudoduganella violacea]MBB3120088.1 uncharacterized protein (DUF1800 family) [Pseudoduganella violacea]
MPAPSFRPYSITFVLLLTACGGSTDRPPQHDEALPPSRLGQRSAAPMAAAVSITPQEASRFLAQASFGPTSQSISEAAKLGPAAWLDNQFGKPQRYHRSFVEARSTGGKALDYYVYDSFWQQAVRGEDQLRQRMAFALSQIFVISMLDDNVGANPRGVASYYDMLATQAFGNFRQLLKAVALHPMMGLYMSHLRNQKEAPGRLPDQNFAREIMQLMSIGLYELNQDGSLKLSGGRPIETYDNEDVAGLAKVFTGWSWAGPDKAAARFYGRTAAPNRDWEPMQPYPEFHSSGSKQVLGRKISDGNPYVELEAALDILAAHPNVGPFIGRQLIQRLVTSNPSPAYVGRVAAAFNNNGKGVRGDMKAVIRAILLDAEARRPPSGNSGGKLREPVLRLANWMRAFNATSKSGYYQMWHLDDPVRALGQTAMRSPTVFNFYRPAYTPPNSSIAAAGLVAPEFQITAEPSVIGYLNYMQFAIPHGLGRDYDIRADYRNEFPLAMQPEQLVERLNLLLLNGAMSPGLRQQIVQAVNNVPVPARASQARYISDKQYDRVHLAIYLAMSSPEYLVQK